MKESEKILENCVNIYEEYYKCVKEAGYRRFYSDVCGNLGRQYSKCRFELVNLPLQQSNNGAAKIEKVLLPNEEKTTANIMLRVIPKIEDSFEKVENYPSVTERYYKQLYFLHNDGPQGEHHCVLVHSNKICLIALAPSHPIIKERKKILKLDFQVTNKVDRLQNKVSGKGKKGGQHIMPDSVLCFVECEDGTKYTIWGCIKGKLVEINQLLLKDPNILVEKPLSQGFVAIILPSIKDLENYKSKLSSQEKYDNEILQME